MATTKAKPSKARSESGKRLARVLYLENLRSFVVEMEDGRGYVLPVDQLNEADQSSVLRWRLGPGRHYFSVTQESGNRFDVPWDAVLYHCEPSYEYYKGTRTGVAPDSRAQRIGQRVRAERERKGMTINQLAERAKLQRPNLSRLELGRHEPSLETLERVAAALQVPVARLVAN